MRPFKKGDIIRCVDPPMDPPLQKGDIRPVMGGVYTVYDTHTFLYREEVILAPGNLSWWASRFVLHRADARLV